MIMEARLRGFLQTKGCVMSRGQVANACLMAVEQLQKLIEEQNRLVREFIDPDSFMNDGSLEFRFPGANPGNQDNIADFKKQATETMEALATWLWMHADLETQCAMQAKYEGKEEERAIHQEQADTFNRRATVAFRRAQEGNFGVYPPTM
jgi:hypothetical protein